MIGGPAGSGLSRPESTTSAVLPGTVGPCPLLIVIVNYKTAGLTVACLETVRPELDEIPGARVVVVENASGEGEALASSILERGWGNWVHLEVVEDNGGYSAGNNRGIGPALESANPPRYVLLLNADTEVRPGALRSLVDFMDANPEVGIAGSSFENLDGSDWTLAFNFFTPLGELERGPAIRPADPDAEAPRGQPVYGADRPPAGRLGSRAPR